MIEETKRNTTHFWVTIVVFAIVLFVALLLRLHKLGDVAYWQDEAFSLHMAEYSFSDVLTRCSNDTHPPVFFLALKGWVSVFGNNEWDARLFSTLWSLCAVTTAFCFTKEALNHAEPSGRNWRSLCVAALAGLCLAFSPLQIRWAQQVRMYAPVAFLSVLGTWLLWRAIVRPEASWRWGVFACVEIVAAHVHVTMYFLIAAHGLSLGAVILQERKNRELAKALTIQGMKVGTAIVLFALPWLLVVRNQHARVHDNFWIKPFSLELLGEEMVRCFGIPKVPVDNANLGLFIAQGLIIVLVLVALRRRPFDIILAVTGGLPIVALISMSITGRNIVLAQYFIGAQSVCFVAAAVCVSRIPYKPIAMGAGFLATGGMAWLSIEYHSVRSGPIGPFALREIHARWQEHSEPDELLIYGNPMIFNVARYYNNERSRALLYGAPESYPFYMGTATLSPSDGIAPELIDSQTNRFWLCDRPYRRSVMPPIQISSSWRMVAETMAHDYTGRFVLKCYDRIRPTD